MKIVAGKTFLKKKLITKVVARDGLIMFLYYVVFLKYGYIFPKIRFVFIADNEV